MEREGADSEPDRRAHEMFFLAGVGRIIVLTLSAIIGAVASVSPVIAQKYLK
jgi:hypothetical protein